MYRKKSTPTNQLSTEELNLIRKKRIQYELNEGLANLKEKHRAAIEDWHGRSSLRKDVEDQSEIDDGYAEECAELRKTAKRIENREDEVDG